MQPSVFVASNETLCRFIHASGNSWRNAVYIECGSCPRAISRRCHNLLCTFDRNAIPILIPEQDAALLWGTVIDKSECQTVLSRAVFLEMYKSWISLHIRDPHACPLCNLHLPRDAPDPADHPIFSNL